MTILHAKRLAELFDYLLIQSPDGSRSLIPDEDMLSVMRLKELKAMKDGGQDNTAEYNEQAKAIDPMYLDTFHLDPSRAKVSLDDAIKPQNRTFRTFPTVLTVSNDPSAGDGYDWYGLKTRPKGYRGPEGLQWGLTKNDWFFLKTDCGTVAVVTRSMLHEIGVTASELPPMSKKDMKEMMHLPDTPMPFEAFHYRPTHSPLTCYWPQMIQDADFIPVLDRTLSDYMIDVLIVHDPDNTTGMNPGDENSMKIDDPTITYRRKDASKFGIPWVEVPPKPELTAHLHLSFSRRLGSGTSGRTYDAYLDLSYFQAHYLFEYCCQREYPKLMPPRTKEDHLKQPFDPKDFVANPSDGTRRGGLPLRFRVVAKIPPSSRRAHAFLDNEAKLYAKFPKHLSQEWTGYQICPPRSRVPQPACAVVPKHYGYFVPEVKYFKLSNGVLQKNLPRDGLLNPILVVENCGSPIPAKGLHQEYK
ncbi:hypothetical protein FRB99_002908 [Tulasnella sp. 403]|nr:hypothetical protein FRB99_002908 [Tulasnella sp. 403]